MEQKNRAKGEGEMSLETKEYAKRLVEQMTLEEKISQMRYESPAIERLHIPAYNWWNASRSGKIRCGDNVPTGNCPGSDF